MSLRKPAVIIFDDGREVCSKNAAGKREYQRRLEEMAKRQKNRCALLDHPLSFVNPYGFRPTFDHEAGRGMGGGHRDDRILNEDGTWKNAAVCALCNQRKGSKRYAWINGTYQPVERVA